MTLQVASGVFTVTTGAGGTTFDISPGFTPVALIVAWSGRATLGQGEATHISGMGFATSTSSRRYYTTQSVHGAGTSVTDSIWGNNAIVATLDTAGAIVGLLDLNSMTQFVVDDQFPAALVVGWFAIGGDVSATITDFTGRASAGSDDVNVGLALNTGEDDKALVLLHTDSTSAAGSNSTDSSITVGVAAGNSIAQAVLNGFSDNNAAAQESFAYCLAGEFGSSMTGDAGALWARTAVTAWTSTGFTHNYIQTDGTAARYSVLALLATAGDKFFVGDFTTATNTTPFQVSTPYEPIGLLFGSAGRAESTTNVSTAHDERIIGAAAGPSARWSMGVMDKNAATTSDIGIAARDDCFYVKQSTAATIAVDGLADLVSFDSDPGFTVVMDDADSSESFVFFLGLANAAAVGGGGSILRQMLLNH